MRLLKWIAAALAVVLIVFALGPRVDGDTTVTFEPATIGDDPDAYLAAEEAKFSNIRPGQQKQIIWAGAVGQKTPLAIVYVHGFSASSGEVRPLPDEIAKAMGANLFFTRLTGHGQDGPAMGTATVNAWVNDYAEAMAIGRMIGEKVVVVATSTGGSLAVAQALNADVSKDVSGLVLISPNFGVQAGGSFLLTMPWGKQLAELIVGKERSFEPRNARQAELWTSRYPTVAVLPMAKLVEISVDTRVEDTEIPALFIISDSDKVVQPALTRQIAARWGAPHQLIAVTNSEDPDQHVIAGDTLSPGTTASLGQQTVSWLKENGIVK
jgi:pimeloyl-ACP methyl ester carboxylesterase